MNYSIATALQNNLGINAILVAVALGLGGLFFKLKSILELHDYVKSKRLRFIKEALLITTITTPMRSYLEDELNSAVFKEVTRITASKVLLERILDVAERSRGAVTVPEMRRAREYLKVRKGVLTIEISKLNFIFFLYAILALLYFVIITAWLASLLYSAKNFESGGLLAMGIIVTSLGAGYFFLQMLNLIIARQIRKPINILEQERLIG